MAELIVCPLPQSIDTLVALVVLQETTELSGVVPVVGETEIELQEGAGRLSTNLHELLQDLPGATQDVQSHSSPSAESRVPSPHQVMI